MGISTSFVRMNIEEALDYSAVIVMTSSIAVGDKLGPMACTSIDAPKVTQLYNNTTRA